MDSRCESYLRSRGQRWSDEDGGQMAGGGVGHTGMAMMRRCQARRAVSGGHVSEPGAGRHGAQRLPRSSTHQARSCGSLRISYAFWISLNRSSASSRLSWFLSAGDSPACKQGTLQRGAGGSRRRRAATVQGWQQRRHQGAGCSNVAGAPTIRTGLPARLGAT